MTNMTGQFSTGSAARDFILAGNARVTLVSQKSGARFTFRVAVPKKAEPGCPHFVSLLSGSDNESAYTFLGSIFTERKYAQGSNDASAYTTEHTYRHGKKSKISPAAPSAKAWGWAWSYLSRGELPPGCEVWHEGRCGCCNRALTVPESIATGIGPICAEKLAA